MRNKRKFRRNRRRIRRRRRTQFNIVRYPLSTMPNSFGPGRRKLVVTKYTNGPLTPEVTQNLYYDYLRLNPELEKIQSEFKYAKIKGFSISFFPRNLPVEGNQVPAYLMVNYDGTRTAHMRLQDNVKIIPPYLTRTRTYNFNIPAINSNGGILNKWVLTGGGLSIYDAILIQLDAPGNTTSWNFRVDIILTLKGPTTSTAETNKDQLFSHGEEPNKDIKSPIINPLIEEEQSVTDSQDI